MDVKDIENQRSSADFKDTPPAYVAHSNLLPTPDEVWAYLKVLQAFKRLSNNFKGSNEWQAKNWKTYLSLSVRQFNVYVSALKWKFPHPDDIDDLIDFVHTIIPPLNVLMVWHSYLLMPKSFHANFSANGFEHFTLCPFPVLKVTRKIDKAGRFEIPDTLVAEFTKVLRSYTDKTGIFYKSNSNFSPSLSWSCPVYCPNCARKWGYFYALSQNELNDGFFEKGLWGCPDTRCNCFKNSHISHGLLRKLLLLKDTKSDAILPPVAKYYDQVHMNGGAKDLQSADKEIKQLTAKISEYNNITDLIRSEKQLDPLKLCVLRDYNEMNLISFTIPHSDRIIIREDLVACLVRHHRFIDQITNVNWTSLDHIWIDVENAIERYSNFFSLMSSSSHLAVPTLDIDIVWHTALMNYNKYAKFSSNVAGRFIDHHDKVEEERLNEGFQRTCASYSAMFGSDYLVCNYCICGSCTIKKVFNKKHHHEMAYSSGIISDHNAIRVPTQEPSFSKKPSSSKSSRWPSSSSLFQFTDTFVTDPYTPANTFNPSSTLKLYKTGGGVDSPDVAGV